MTVLVDADGQEVFPGHAEWENADGGRLLHTPVTVGCVGQFELAWDSGPLSFFSDSDEEFRQLEGMRWDPLMGTIATDLLNNWPGQEDEIVFEVDEAAPYPGFVVPPFAGPSPDEVAERNVRSYAERHGIDPDLLLNPNRARVRAQAAAGKICRSCWSGRVHLTDDGWARCHACGEWWQLRVLSVPLGTGRAPRPLEAFV